MTLQQFQMFGKDKIKCKVFNEKETRYVLASSLQQCKAKFTGNWNIEELTEQQYLENTKFSKQ